MVRLKDEHALDNLHCDQRLEDPIRRFGLPQ